MSSTLHTATIRGRREALGLTQKQAAKLAGVTEPTWQRFEVGEKLDLYLAKRCARLVSGEIAIPADTQPKRTEKESGALATNRHRWTRDEAREAGKKGAEPFRGRGDYMAELGRKGGAETQRRRRKQP